DSVHEISSLPKSGSNDWSFAKMNIAPSQCITDGHANSVPHSLKHDFVVLVSFDATLAYQSANREKCFDLTTVDGIVRWPFSNKSVDTYGLCPVAPPNRRLPDGGLCKPGM